MTLFDPATILYPPYLLSAYLIGSLWLKLNSNLNWRESFFYFLKKDFWLNKETLIDLFSCLCIIFIIKKIYSPIDDWIFNTQWNFLTNLFKNQSGISWGLKLPSLAEGLLATSFTMLAIDAASFYTHKLMHQYHFLWKIHRFHHSLTQLNFLSTHRQNPLEFILLNIARTLSAAFALAFFHWFFPSETPVITINGLGAGFFFYMFTVNLHHAPIPVRYPKFLRLILISPHVHHLHHSAKSAHHGKNFGVVFSFWDRLHRSYYEEDVKINELGFGNHFSKAQA